jgi:predicted NBD/HSP70 family sugar kinase
MNHANYLSFDIGGTSIKYGLIDSKKHLTYLGKLDTLRNKDNAILNQIITKSTELIKQHSIAGIGISTAGIVDPVAGKILFAGPTIPNYIGTELKQTLEDEFSLPVMVENDVNSALLGEKLVGVAQEYSDIYCVALGTGIGGAHYDHGRLHRGYNGQANSIGYLQTSLNGSKNYEETASTLSLESKLKIYFKKSVPEAFEIAKNQTNPAIEKIIDDWMKKVAYGIVQIILIADPELIVLGGGVSKQGDFLLQHVNEYVSAALPANFYQTKMVIAASFNDAALYGAVYNFFK